MVDQTALHHKYGQVIRLAPNEISFAAEQAWMDTMCIVQAIKTLLKIQYGTKVCSTATDLRNSLDSFLHQRQMTCRRT